MKLPMAFALGLALLTASSAAQSHPTACARSCVPRHNSSWVDASGTDHITRVVPVPQTVSPEARKLIGSTFANQAPGQKPSQPALAQSRAYADATEARLGREAQRWFPAHVAAGVIAGVPVRIVTPPNMPAGHASRVLINLHGGGFVADWGSLTETIPIASLTHTRVVSVLYRMAPEHPFPAAVDDAVAVYRALLKTYRPQSIGLYGTSAGAILTAETAAELRRIGLPLPAALGIFSGSGDLSRRGDTESIFGVTGLAGPVEATPELPFASYVEATNRRNPILSPAFADLRGFPPALFLSSTRDMLLSDTALLQRAFLHAGVPTQMVVFEALQHGFWNDPALPESREADHIIAEFFDRHLQ